MKYKVRYFFDGTGEVAIEAKSKKEAEDKYLKGDWSSEKEWGDSYNIDKVEEIMEDNTSLEEKEETLSKE